jgi:plastocyanin
VPQVTEVAAGTEIVFTNNGRNPHNVVPEGDPKATTWGVLEAAFDPTDTYSQVFDRPGTYVYYCTIHGSVTAGMVGTITVTAP